MSFRTLRSQTLFFLLCLLPGLISAQSNLFEPPIRGFTSWLPAPNWEHALLSGNGTIGALVFGNPHEETIILSQGQLFLPQERSKELIDQADSLQKIRELISNGRYEDAAKIPVEIREKDGYSDQRDPFIPAFDIKITQEAANINQYLRATNFETGETKTTWTDDKGTFQRKLFVSRADSVAVLSIKSDDPINCVIGFEHRPVNWDQWDFVGGHVGDMTARAEGNWLTYRSDFKKKYQGSLEGYEGVGRLTVKGGTTRVVNNQIQINDANEVLLLIDIRPSFNYPQSLIPEMKERLSSIESGYDDLLKRHVAIHGKIFSRMKLDLHANEENKNLNSEELLLKARETGVSAALIEKVFDAGRYNILSSTGIRPPNLQGIWSGTWTAPWSAGYTHDGNLPSAMSVVMPGNMPELMRAYVSYLEQFTPDFEDNARKLFGTRGINLPAHTTTSGRPTDFNQTWCLTFWTGGAGWAADIMYDYYRYTGDMDFLKEHAYPWLKKVASFYEDFLIEGEDNKYIFNPSYSPENQPLNGSSQAAINATMDVMIAKQVLIHAVEAGQIMDESKKRIKKWQNMIKKMPEYQINKEGVLREWVWPGLEDNYRHRHVSQLYSLYNSMDPDILDNEPLKKGAEKLIEKKLEFRENEGGGEMAFGLVQLGLSAAHLGEADKAYEAVKWLSTKYWSTGLGSFHNVGNLLNTDISGGLPAVIIQMLAYSQEGRIYLLPALPQEWNEGTLTGALLRNQIVLKELTWKGDKVTARLFSTIEQALTITLPREILKVSSDNQLHYSRVKNQNYTAKVELPAGQELKIDFILKQR